MSKVCFLIHGYLTDFHDFQDLPQKLIKEYDQVILLCLPGHECKENLNDFTFKKTMKYIDKEIISSINKGDIIDIIGFSLGGALGWYIGMKYKVHRLVLLAPALDNLNTRLIVDKIKYLYSIRNQEEYNFLVKKFHQKEKEAVTFAFQNTIPKFNIHNGIEFLKIINYINQQNEFVKKPCLIIRGDLDELVKAKVINKIKNRIDSYYEIHRIENIGHMMLRTDEKDQIETIIINFLKRDI